MLKTKTKKRIFSVLLAQALVLSLALTGTAPAVYAAGTDKTEDKETVEKEEVVYVITDSDGEVDEIIVNDTLSNKDGLEVIKDTSDLTDIENVKGDEEFTEGDDQSISWKADGNEISYQGNSTKELPVDVKLSFSLDGRPVSASQLAGKSGKVKIRFDYENKETRKVSVKGKEYNVYVPFTMVSGTILDADRFTNVSVENGKAVKEGDKIIVFGYAVPGLKESLDPEDKLLGDTDIEVPEYVEITADVKDFELGMTMTAVTNDLLSQIKAEDAGNDDLEEGIDELSDATDKLVDGTGTLAESMGTAYKGTKTIAENMNKVSSGSLTLAQALGKYTNGVDVLYSKVPDLKDGVNVLETGASRLAKGAASLKTGTETYVNGVDTLAGGLLGDGTKKNPGYLAGVEALADGASKLSGLSRLGDVSDAVSLMKSATGSDTTYTMPDGSKSPTLGYAAGAVEGGLEQVIGGLKEMKDSTTGESLKTLAGSMDAAAKTLTSASQAVSSASEDLNSARESAGEKIGKAAEEIGSQAANIDKAKDQLEGRQKEINDAIDKKNEEISSRNKEISEAKEKINDAAGDCNSGIENTVSGLREAKKQLESARKALEEAQTEEVSFKDQIGKLNKEIDDLQARIDSLKDKKVSGADIESVSEIGTSDVSLDLTGISSDTLSGYGKDLEGISIEPLNVEKQIGTISAIAAGVSEASGKMTTDPLDTLIGSLQKVKEGASGVKAGISSLHTNLNSLETATAQFPAAAKGITALNEGFTVLTQNNGTIRAGAAALLQNGPILASGAKEVADGSAQMAGGTETLAKGTSTLSKGVSKLASNNSLLNKGAGDLAKGTSLLSEGTGKLSDGMDKLLEGAETLKDGMEEYRSEGISEIIDLYREDILGLKDRFEAVKEAGNDYQIYTRISDGEKGNVKFIYKSDEIKAEDSDKE